MDLMSWTPEYFAANEAACIQHINNPEVRATVPLLNCAQLHDLRDNMLVRFRGMIQDMQDPECYLESYEVRQKEGDTLVRVQNGKYRDVLVMNRDQESVDFKASSNKYGERRSIFVISIPGFNKWALECEKKMSPSVGTKLPDETDVTSNAKRPLEEQMETDNVSTNENVFKKPMLPSGSLEGSSKATASKECKQSLLSAQYLLNSPISGRPSKACLVKLYTNIDESTLNTTIDVVGFLSVDPALDGSTDQIEDFDDEMTEHQATHPPPSLIPRIHAISIRKLDHVNPLLQSSHGVQLDNFDIWRDIHNLMTQCLFGDKVAADYLLCHLISTVYVRNEVESLGQFSLNISNIPAEVLPEYTKAFYEILELLLPASHYFPMTLENMNTVQFVPK